MPETPLIPLISQDERTEIETLISNFDDHGCGFGYDLQAQAILRHLLEVLAEAEQTIEGYRARLGDATGG